MTPTNDTLADLLRKQQEARQPEDAAGEYPGDPEPDLPTPAAGPRLFVERADGRPEIVLGTDEHTCTDLAIEALAHDPDLFFRAQGLVRVQREGEGRRNGRPAGTPTIRTLPTPSIRERITRYALLTRMVNNKVVSAHPPQWLVLQVESRGLWPSLRRLEGVIEAPTIRADGTILDVPGYDEQTELLYLPGCDYPPIPPTPSRDDAVRAGDHLLSTDR